MLTKFSTFVVTGMRLVFPLVILAGVLLSGCAVVSVGEFQDSETEEAGEHSLGVGITVLGVDPAVLEGQSGVGYAMHVPAYFPNELRYRYGLDDRLEVHAGLWSVNWAPMLLSLGTIPARDIGAKAGARRMLTERGSDWMLSAGFDAFGYTARLGEDTRFPQLDDTGQSIRAAGGSMHATGTAVLGDDAREAFRLLSRYLPIVGRADRVYGGLKLQAMWTDVTWHDNNGDQTASGMHIIPMPYIGITSGRRIQQFTEINGLVYFDEAAGQWQPSLGFGVGVRIPLGR